MKSSWEHGVLSIGLHVYMQVTPDNNVKTTYVCIVGGGGGGLSVY